MRGWLITGRTGSGKTQCAINTITYQIFQNVPHLSYASSNQSAPMKASDLLIFILGIAGALAGYFLPPLRVGNRLRVGLEIDDGDGGTVRILLMRATVHVGRSERESLAENEFRVRFAADGRWRFDWHRS